MGGDHRKPPRWRSASSARDLELAADGEGYEITGIVRGDPWDAERRFAAQRDRRRGEGRRAHRRGQRPAGVARRCRRRRCSCTRRAPRSSSRSRADRRRRAPCSSTTLADEVPARYREWVERNRAWVHAQSKRQRRLLPSARHAVGRLRRIPSLLHRRVRPRRADRRPALQPRRPRLAAAAREDRAQAHRLRPVALGEAAAVSGRGAARAGGRADQRARGLATATSSRTASS